MRRKVLAALTVAVTVSLVPGAASAGPHAKFRAELSGSEEVPPRATPASGKTKFKLAKDGSNLRFDLHVRHITNVVAAHIHCGPPGVNGPVVVTLYGPAAPGGGPENGKLAKGSAPISGVTCPDGTPLLEAMRQGNTYVNVHTDDGAPPANTGPGDFPGGEVRGQIRSK